MILYQITNNFGKSYLMNFDSLFGQETILNQITNNSEMSIIYGQDFIKTEIDENEKSKLKKAYKSIKNLIKEKNCDLKEEKYNLILTKILNVLKSKEKITQEDKKNINKS